MTKYLCCTVLSFCSPTTQVTISSRPQWLMPRDKFATTLRYMTLLNYKVGARSDQQDRRDYFNLFHHCTRKAPAPMQSSIAPPCLGRAVFPSRLGTLYKPGVLGLLDDAFKMSSLSEQLKRQLMHVCLHRIATKNIATNEQTGREPTGNQRPLTKRELVCLLARARRASPTYYLDDDGLA